MFFVSSRFSTFLRNIGYCEDDGKGIVTKILKISAIIILVILFSEMLILSSLCVDFN